MAGLRAYVAWFDARRRLIVVLLVGWALVIASGSGAPPGEPRWLGVPSIERVLVPVVVLYLVVVVGFLVYAVAANARRPAELPDRRPQWRVLLLLVLLVILALVFPRSEADNTVAVEAEPVEVVEPPRDGGPVAGRNESLALLAVLGLAVGVLVWSRRRVSRPENELETEVSAPVLEPLIGSAIDGLRLGTDPRSAVIDAYSRLEQALAEHGAPRGDTETANEHIRRCLAHLHLDTGPLRQLAQLYELARFSDHPIDEADQRRAVDGLIRVRRDLAAAPASAGLTS